MVKKSFLPRIFARLVFGSILVSIFSTHVAADDSIDLSGDWQFKLDPNDEGVAANWFFSPLPDQLELPGSCQEQGYGEIPSKKSDWTVNGSYLQKLEALPHFKPFLEKGGKFRHPFWWTPDRLYVGPAWYQKEVEVPQSWGANAIKLMLQRVHWESKLWVDETLVGMENGIGTPHVYDLSKILTPGTHRLTLRIDNRIKEIDIGAGGHSISDHTQSNWNGIIGEMELVCSPPIHIQQVRVDATDYRNKTAKLRFSLRNLTNDPANVELAYQAKTVVGKDYVAAPGVLTTTLPAQSNQTIEVDYPLGNEAPLWNEFDPAVFQLESKLTIADQTSESNGLPHKQSTTFGIRSIERSGNRIMVNGRKVFLRGTLDCCLWPQTGYPPMDRESWNRVFKIVKDHGLNHVRYHSWTPPNAAYEAADEMGIYLQPESLMWVKFGAGAAIDDWIKEEAKRCFLHYGNHPSFAMMAIGNECSNGSMEYADETIGLFQKTDPRRIYTDNVRGCFSKLCDFNVKGVKFSNRRSPGADLSSNNTDYDPNDYFSEQEQPTITHEDGQWSTWPNMAEESKYTGSLHPYYLEVYRDLMKQAGVWDRYDDYFRATGKLQVSLYKATVEASLKAADCAGFQLLDLRDFPGQGYAPVGILDPFWDSKGYCTADEFRSFCDSTVPLARFKSYVVPNDQLLDTTIQVAHYGPSEITSASISWTLSTPTKTLGEGVLSADLPTGTVTTVGRIAPSLQACAEPTQATLTVAVKGTRFVNQWPVWIYPAASKTTNNELDEKTIIADQIDDQVRQHLENGGSVLLTPPPAWIKGNTAGAFSPIYWTRVMFRNARVHTIGAYVDADHPALAAFPTECFTDWQWYDLMENSKPVELASFPKELRPMVEPIDDWNRPRRLGLIFEGKVGNGKLLFCAINIGDDLESRPAATQLRRSLLSYMASDDFEPQTPLDAELFEQVIVPVDPGLVERSYASSTANGYEIALAFDNNPETFWHSSWTGSDYKMPQSLTLDLGKPTTISGIRYQPRLRGNNNTRVKSYRILVSDDANSWREIAEGVFSNRADLQSVFFNNSQTTQFLRFVITEPFAGQTVSVAEIAVF